MTSCRPVSFTRRTLLHGVSKYLFISFIYLFIYLFILFVLFIYLFYLFVLFISLFLYFIYLFYVFIYLFILFYLFIYFICFIYLFIYFIYLFYLFYLFISFIYLFYLFVLFIYLFNYLESDDVRRRLLTVNTDKDLKEDGIPLQKQRKSTKFTQLTRNPNFGIPQSPFTHPTRNSGALISITCMFDSFTQNQRVEGRMYGSVHRFLIAKAQKQKSESILHTERRDSPCTSPGG